MKKLSHIKSLLYCFFDFLTWGIRRWNNVGEKIRLPDMPRILLIEFYGLGDLVILSGVLDSLLAQWPKAKITLLAPPCAEPLFSHDHRIDVLELFPFPWHPHLQKHAPHRWNWKAIYTLLQCLRKREWDIILGRSDLAMNILSRLIHPRYAMGLDYPGGKYFLTHRVQRDTDSFEYEGLIWLAYLQKLGCAPMNYRPRIVCDPDDEESRIWLERIAAWHSPKRALIAIHPGASSLAKCWPVERFRQLAHRFKERADILWFVDQNHLFPDEKADWVMPVSCGLKAFSNLVSRCDCFLGNDSGGTHIAASLGCPTFEIFALQRPDRYAPLNLAGVFFSSLCQYRPCRSPCRYSGIPPCLDRITVLDVGEKIEQFLDKSIK